MLRVSGAKQRRWSKELYERAVEFHGHGGPFMIAGLRMGLTALERLDAKGWFHINCTVELKWEPPDSCVIDGIQSSTGCTMGKGNIGVLEGEGVSAEFTKGEERLRMTLIEGVLDEMRRAAEAGGEEAGALMSGLIEAEVSELFELS